ncbi:MAG: RnfABCDGE type electron transport complex subunit G [Clostridia bacterium]|nr:RnfABCDGE type electron transport complex subunit G [Clostridia bacterium]
MSDEKKTGVTPENETENTAPVPEKKDKGVPGKYLVRLIVVLAAVCVVIAALLATVNAVTKDKIAAHKAEAQEAAVRKVFPEAEKIALYEAEGLDTDVYLIYRDGALAGYAARVLPSGFGGEIEMMVGVDVNGQTAGVSIISMSETPGVGSKTNSESFLKQFQGKDGNVKVGDGVDAISGATISSKAVTEGVRMAHALGIDLQKIAEELGVPVWDGSGVTPPESESESETEPGPEPVDSESETETEVPTETETEEPFSENGDENGGVLPVDVEETDDRYEVEIEREGYESMLDETDEATTAAPPPEPTSATQTPPPPPPATSDTEAPEPPDTESQEPDTEPIDTDTEPIDTDTDMNGDGGEEPPSEP